MKELAKTEEGKARIQAGEVCAARFMAEYGELHRDDAIPRQLDVQPAAAQGENEEVINEEVIEVDHQPAAPPPLFFLIPLHLTQHQHPTWMSIMSLLCHHRLAFCSLLIGLPPQHLKTGNANGHRGRLRLAFRSL